MLAKIEAILFDMDGTLIDSRPIIEHAWRSVAQEYNIELNQDLIDQHVHGRSGDYTRDFLFSDLNEKERSIAKQKVDLIEETAEAQLIVGVIDALDTFHRKGLKMALVTASWDRRIQFIFAYHKLHHYFDTIISRQDVTLGKPHPEGFLLAAKQLGCDIKNCLVFEDSRSGMEAALESGATCISIGSIKCYSLPIYASYANFDLLLQDDLLNL